MAELEGLRQKVEDLLRRYSVASRKRSEMKGQIEAVKADLSSLADEIKAAGFNPRTLKADKDKALQELSDLVEAFDRELGEVEESIKAFEEK